MWPTARAAARGAARRSGGGGGGHTGWTYIRVHARPGRKSHSRPEVPWPTSIHVPQPPTASAAARLAPVPGPARPCLPPSPPPHTKAAGNPRSLRRAAVLSNGCGISTLKPLLQTPTHETSFVVQVFVRGEGEPACPTPPPHTHTDTHAPLLPLLRCRCLCARRGSPPWPPPAAC